MIPPAHLTPLRFAPLYKEKVWGGQRLRSVLGKSIPAAAKIGESWEISGFGTDQTCVDGGLLTGKKLGEVLASYGDHLTGSATRGDGFPLLYKFIDAHDKLSVQVHPDDEQAQAHGWGNRGKTECWYIIHADPGAQTIAGFNRPVTLREVEEAIRGGTLDKLLNFIDIFAGDVINIPAGTVHANQPGTLLYEVQQTSDTTLRLYDWDRNDPARPLHIAESLSVLDTTFHTGHKIPPVTTVIAEGVVRKIRAVCRYFALAEYSIQPAREFALPQVPSFQVLTTLDGATVVHSSRDTFTVDQGQSLLLPADLSITRVSAGQGSRFLLSWVPNIRRDIVDPLRAQDIADQAIIALSGGNPARNDVSPVMMRS